MRSWAAAQPEPSACSATTSRTTSAKRERAGTCPSAASMAAPASLVTKAQASSAATHSSP